MSSSQDSGKATRGTYVSFNGRELYVETYTLESIILNNEHLKIPSSMFNRIRTIFSSQQTDPSQTYVMLAHDYHFDKYYTYKLAGFWNPQTKDYEFEQQ